MDCTITDAVVVRLVDQGESNRVVTLITRALGKVHALARGSRKSRRRFGGALELFSVGEARVSRGRGELWMLDSIAARAGFGGIAHDLVRVAHAAYLCELARELIPDEHPEEELFDRLCAALLRLADPASPASASSLRLFELELLATLGWAPSLDRCSRCARPADGGARFTFDAHEGGALCPACSHPRALALPEAARRAMVEALAAHHDGPLAALPPPDALAAREILRATLDGHLHRPLRSLEFIGKVNRAGLEDRGGD